MDFRVIFHTVVVRSIYHYGKTGDEDYCRLLEYNQEGRVVGESSIDMSKWFFEPVKIAKTDSFGRIYVMSPYKNFIIVDRITIGQGNTFSLDASLPEEYCSFDLQNDDSGLARVGVWHPYPVQNTTVSRASASGRADNMHTMEWYFRPGHNRWDDWGADAPAWLDELVPVELVSGIPYCYGGMNGYETVTGPYGEVNESFVTAVLVNDPVVPGNRYYTTGDVSDSNGKARTIGVDCSGFVSSVYGFSCKVDTAKFYATSDKMTQINYSALQNMDLIVKQGHAALFKYVVSTANNTIRTVESNTAEAKVTEWTRTLSAMQSGGYIFKRPNAWS